MLPWMIINITVIKFFAKEAGSAGEQHTNHITTSVRVAWNVFHEVQVTFLRPFSWKDSLFWLNPKATMRTKFYLTQKQVVLCPAAASQETSYHTRKKSIAWNVFTRFRWSFATNILQRLCIQVAAESRKERKRTKKIWLKRYRYAA
jgi:hypothetical protein